MNFIKFCGVFLVLLCVVHINGNYQCGIRKHSFIQLVYRGWKVKEGQWPWHVAVYHKVQNESAYYACGASLIGQKHIVTAAHCAVNQTKHSMSTKDIVLHFGQVDLSTTTNRVQIRDVARIYVHPEYKKHRNDIAVLELRLPVEFTDYVIPICLDMRIDKDLRALEGQRGWITGWGTTQNGSTSGKLRSASLPVVSYLQCVQNDPTLFGQVVNPNVFCAGDRNGTSPGTGDSGGGMYFSEGDRWVLRGIVSFAKIDETRLRVDTSKYTVFVNVQRYLTWIREVMEDRSLNSSLHGATKRISEQECDRFKSLVKKHSNGICSNARYPHTVSLIQPFGKIQLQICTGILINENHTLTSCHCMNTFRNMLRAVARIGEYDAVDVSSLICHPSYDQQKRRHDLAILRLARSVQLSQNVVPACLASNWTENLYDTLLTTGFRVPRQTGVKQFFESDANQVIASDECNRNSKASSIGGWQDSKGNFSAQLCVTNSDPLPTVGWGSDGAPLQSVHTRTCSFTVVGVLNDGSNGDRVMEQTPSDEIFSRVLLRLDREDCLG